MVALPHISEEIFGVGRYYPCLIVLDIMLAGMDGRDICRFLKTHPDFHTIPILLFSASNIPRSVAILCGTDDFIAKPFDLDDLPVKVDALQQHSTAA